MAVAALIALAHDIVITVGRLRAAGFQVSPATVIGLLTILGYSLYDTVVVFDKVRENTAGLLGSARSTYSQAANLALNQTLVRSINTSVIALLPVAAILFIGGGPARRRRAERPGAGAVRRHAVRHLLLDLHRHPGAGRPQGAGPAVQGAGQAGRASGPPAAAPPSARPRKAGRPAGRDGRGRGRGRGGGHRARRRAGRADVRPRPTRPVTRSADAAAAGEDPVPAGRAASRGAGPGGQRPGPAAAAAADQRPPSAVPAARRSGGRPCRPEEAAAGQRPGS